MDSRSKIVSLHEIQERIQNRRVKRLAGHFDPLLAEHVRRLAQAREPGCLLVVEVTNPVQPLLSQRARAELVAALSVIDFVVLGSGVATSEDEDITEDFIQLVLQRHSQESAR